MPADTSRYTPREGVSVAEFDGEAVLLDVVAGTYYGLDQVGAEVWRLLTHGRTVGEVVDALLDQYEVEPGRLRSDLDRLLDDLSRARLVVLE